MSKKINVAVVGVGNCFSSLYQGITFYKDHDEDTISGVAFKRIGGYHPADINVVAAFDIDRRKVGRPVSEAIFAKPNCARIFQERVPEGPIVQMGEVLDGVAQHMEDFPEDQRFAISDEDTADVISTLKDRNVHILLNYLPVGSQEATEFYMNCALEAGVGVCNCIPVFIASNPQWEQKFIDRGLTLIGDDMRSQFGASILSQVIQETAFERGMVVNYHQQLNIGGNTDFLNMLDQSRLSSKKKSKENVIRAQNELRKIPVPKDSLFAGPSTYIPYLKDNKVAYFNVRMAGFGGSEIDVDIKLSVQDSENSAGVVIDALRFLRVAQEMGIVGALRGPSALTQKTPPQQMTFASAIEECKHLANRKLTDSTSQQRV